jgi:hypothetical protein
MITVRMIAAGTIVGSTHHDSFDDALEDARQTTLYDDDDSYPIVAFYDAEMLLAVMVRDAFDPSVSHTVHIDGSFETFRVDKLTHAVNPVRVIDGMTFSITASA